MSAIPPTTRQQVPVSTPVIVWAPDLFDGPRAGIITNAGTRGPIRNTAGEVVQEEGQLVTLNLLVDGSQDRDKEVLAVMRERPEGNTFTGVPVFDPLPMPTRAYTLANIDGVNGTMIAELRPY